MLSAWLLLLSTSFAGTLAEPVASAKAALRAKDAKAAVAALAGVEEGVRSGAVVDPAELASVFYLRGVALRLEGDKKKKAPDLWRSALAIDNSLPWDESLLDDGDAFSYFEALRGEVRSRGEVDPQVPEALGAAKAYVDGNRVRMGDTVIAGLHLAQISCDDGTIQGTWTSFDKPVKWVKLCPNGIDTSVVVADGGDDIFGDVFGGPDAPSDPPPTPVEPSRPSEPSSGARPSGLVVGLTAAGGGLLATGVVLNFVVAAPAWAAIEDARSHPEQTTAAEASAATQKFQVARVVTLTAGGLGVGLLAGGATLHFMSLSVAPSPNGLLLYGRF